MPRGHAARGRAAHPPPLGRRARPWLRRGVRRSCRAGDPAAVTPADARQHRAVRDGRVLDALRLGGSAEVVAAAVGISPELVRRIAFEARKNGQPNAVPPRRPYRRAK